MSAEQDRARAVWAAGDFPRVARDTIHDVGPALVAAAGVRTGDRVLDVGAGPGTTSIPAALAGGDVVASDLTPELLVAGRSAAVAAGVALEWVEADAEALPFADRSFDIVCSAFGAVPFVADSGAVMAEVARVLRPGGRWVFSVTHPLRWCLPDDPGPGGLQVTWSYFDHRPYVEVDEDDREIYVEHHRTLGDRVREIVAAGLVLLDVVEPEWPPGHDRIWGQWSPLRGRMVPGTAIFVSRKPA